MSADGIIFAMATVAIFALVAYLAPWQALGGLIGIVVVLKWF